MKKQIKRIALLLALVMLVSSIGVTAFAEESAIKESASGFYYVEANGEQPRLSAFDKSKLFEQDGLWFKDLNGNGRLDVYEDWRQDVDARVNDLVSQMDLDVKLGNLANDFTGGAFSPIYPMQDEWLYGQEDHITLSDNITYRPMWWEINKNHVTHYSYSSTGTPKEQLDTLNAIQSIGESATLGIPISFETDRPYNTFGSMVNMPYYAFGVAHDPELLYNMVAQYSKEMAAMGYTTIFHSYGVEIGSWYGDEVNYISDMIVPETLAYEENGLHAMTKHYIARGGRNSFADARSDAKLWENYMVPWKAAVQEGKTSTIMLNAGYGIEDNPIYFDGITLGYLRNELGFEGVICTDWPLNMNAYDESYASDGRKVGDMTLGEKYTFMMECGIDQFGVFRIEHGTDTSSYYTSGSFDCLFWPDVLKAEIEAGKMDVSIVDAAIGRAMKNKFRLGLFEDPFNDYAELEALFASEEYKAEHFELNSVEDVVRARTEQMNAWDEELMEKSAVLLKNDNNTLPLAAGTKVYLTSNSGEVLDKDIVAIGAKTEIVDSFETADVVVAHMTALDETWEYVIEDAKAAGKPIVLVLEGTNGRRGVSVEPTEREASACAAILMQTYNSLPDHGTALPQFYHYTFPNVTADMLFGQRVPQGSLVYEIGRNSDEYLLSWGDLQLDIGVSDEMRLYLAAAIRNQPDLLVPNNLGDVLYTTNFGMTYGAQPDFDINTLVLPKAVQTFEEEYRGSMRTVTRAVEAVQKAGVAFPISFIAQNNGDDGSFMAEVYEGDQLLASKFVALDAGQFRVITIELTLDAGTHEISVCGLTKTIVVE